MEKNKNEHVRMLANSLNNFRDDEEMSDVTIIVGEKEFPAHRLVLSAASEYYRTMFKVQMKENLTSTVEMKDVSASTMKSCIEFIYTGVVNVNDDNVHDLLKASSLQQIEDLKQLCLRHVRNNITVATCLESYNMSKLQNYHDITDAVEKFILENFSEVCKLESFNLSMDENCMRMFLTSDNTKVPDEKTIYETLISWVNYDAENRRELFPDLFGLVRLSLMPTEYLANVVSEEPLVQSDEKCTKLVEQTMLQICKGKSDGKKRIGQGSEKLLLIKKCKDADFVPVLAIEPENKTYDIFSKCPGKSVVACVMAGNKLYVVQQNMDMDILDLKKRSWSLAKGPEGQNISDAAAAVHEGSIFVFGKTGTGYWSSSSKVQKFCLSTNAWSKVPDMGHKRSSFTLNSVEGYGLYAIGSVSAIEKYGEEKWSIVGDNKTASHVEMATVKDQNIYCIVSWCGELKKSNKVLCLFLPDQNIFTFVLDFYSIPDGVSSIWTTNDELYIASTDDGHGTIRILDVMSKNCTPIFRVSDDWSGACFFAARDDRF